MSKIMRALYAEARAAREAAAKANERPNGGTPVTLPLPDPIEPSNERQQTRCEPAGRTLVSDVATTAIQAIRQPVSPEDHVRWWRAQMARWIDFDGSARPKR